MLGRLYLAQRCDDEGRIGEVLEGFQSRVAERQDQSGRAGHCRGRARGKHVLGNTPCSHHEGNHRGSVFRQPLDGMSVQVISTLHYSITPYIRTIEMMMGTCTDIPPENRKPVASSAESDSVCYILLDLDNIFLT